MKRHDPSWQRVAIDVGSMVIAHLVNPKEKVWGVLVRLDAVGLVVRGLDLHTVEDWLRQERREAAGLISPSSLFVPLHRVERIYLDEGTAVSESYADRYSRDCGGDVREALLRGPAEVGEGEVQ